MCPVIIGGNKTLLLKHAKIESIDGYQPLSANRVLWKDILGERVAGKRPRQHTGYGLLLRRRQYFDHQRLRRRELVRIREFAPPVVKSRTGQHRGFTPFQEKMAGFVTEWKRPVLGRFHFRLSTCSWVAAWSFEGFSRPAPFRRPSPARLPTSCPTFRLQPREQAWPFWAMA